MVFSPNYILNDEAKKHLSNDQPNLSPSEISSDNPSSQNAEENVLQTPSELSERRLGNHNLQAPDMIASTSSYHTMTLKSRPYLCSIPTVTPSTNTTESPKDPDAEAAELARATDRGWELLKDMEGNCMYFVSGWWSYSFCYNTAVTQFHSLPPGKGAPLYPPTEDPTTPSYVLGKFSASPNSKNPPAQLDGGEGSKSADTDSTPQLQARSGVRYLVQKLHGGTTCDLTGRDRKVEVQFHCHPQSADRIGWIKEVSTCSYLMVIYTPRLCNDVAFLPPRENKANAITCREIVAEDAVPEYEARKKAERERKLVSANPAGRPVVAGIEVGGMKQVGKEGQRLAAPTQIPPMGSASGNNKADLLARQDAPEKGGKEYRLSKAEVKKLGLDPKLVDEAVKELKQVAVGKAWKLEVFDAPTGGRELRGVVEGDEEAVQEGEVEFYVVGGEEGDDGPLNDEDQGEDGSEEVFKDEL